MVRLAVSGHESELESTREVDVEFAYLPTIKSLIKDLMVRSSAKIGTPLGVPILCLLAYSCDVG